MIDQLENETKESSWIITTNDYKNKIIGKSPFLFWKKQIMELGGKYAIWSNAPENPAAN